MWAALLGWAAFRGRISSSSAFPLVAFVQQQSRTSLDGVSDLLLYPKCRDERATEHAPISLSSRACPLFPFASFSSLNHPQSFFSSCYFELTFTRR